MKRILCLALVLLMLVPMIVSCKKDKDPEVQGSSDVAGDTNPEGPVNLLDTIPVANYNGKEFLITVENARKKEVCVEELTGEAENDTVYQWLEVINGRYGVKVKGQVPDGDFFTAMNTETSSGAVATSIYGTMAYKVYRPVQARQYKNWYSMGSMIDLTAERWDKKVNDGVTWNGVLFGLTGDLGYGKLQGAMATFCNVALLDEIGYSTDDLYEMVDDREWTFEKFQSIVKDIYIDSDYDNKKSGGDTFGYVMISGNSHDVWLEQFGISITEQNEATHELVPTLYNEQNDTLIRELWSFLHELPGVFSWTNNNDYGPEDRFFSDGRAAMITTRLSYAAQFAKDLGAEAYGILPAPLRNEDQADYYTKLFNEFAVWGVSKNILDADVDFIAHITDALCAESSQTLYPKFYDILLKQRYSKDPATARMVDVIMKNVNIDPTFMYNTVLDGYAELTRALLRGTTPPDLASQYGSISSGLPQKLQSIYDLHTEE